MTLALLLVWIVVSNARSGLGPNATVAGVFLVIAVFAIITVHELAHALMARRFGVRTRDILLLPIGGIASLERIPERPGHELAIALVGPAINVVIAVVLWQSIAIAGGELDARVATTVGGAFAAQLLWINVVLAGFNLIPAFPMDGGRALRAVLAMRLGRERATNIAAGLGRVFAVALALVGVFFNPWLVLIAALVWFGARREADMVHLRAAISDIPTSAAMNRQLDTVHPGDPLEAAARLLVASGQSQVPIIDRDGMPIGALTRTDVADGLARTGESTTVDMAPHHDIVTVAPDESLGRVFDRLVEKPDAIAVVIDHGAPIGIISSEQLAAFVSLRAQPTPQH